MYVDIQLDKPRPFRWSIAAALAFERDPGASIQRLQAEGKSLIALTKALYHGLRAKAPKLTETEIEGQLQLYLDAGGDIITLHNQVMEAINQSGVYGKPAPVQPAGDEAGEGGESGDPPAPAADAG